MGLSFIRRFRANTIGPYGTATARSRTHATAAAMYNHDELPTEANTERKSVGDINQ